MQMNLRTTLRLFIAVCLLGGLIWFVRQHFESTDERREQSVRIFRTTTENIDYLTIEWGDIHVDFTNRLGTWFLESPIKARAGKGEIDRILAILEELPVKEVVSAAQRMNRDLTLEDYGLLQPRARFVLGNRQLRRELLVGHDSPLGELVYVKRAEAEDIIATSHAVLEIIPEKIEDLRDRTILHGDAFRTARLEIQRSGHGFIQLVQTAGEWTVQQPVSARADSSKISQMLDALYALKVEKFVWDPVVQPAGKSTAVDVEASDDAGVERYGLASDKAAARISVWVNGDEVGKELVLGKRHDEDSDEIYAKTRDTASIYTISKDILNVFSVDVNDLRNRDLFPIDPADVRYAGFRQGDRKLALNRRSREGWVITEPVHWKADDQVVQELIRRITGLRVESFFEGTWTNPADIGLAPPYLVVQVSAESSVPSQKEGNLEGPGTEAGEGKTATGIRSGLLIGPLSGEKTTVFAKFEDDDSVFEISSESVRSLGEHPTDPLVYRNRTMLALNSKNIRRLTLTGEGKEQTVARDESGVWTVIVPAADKTDLKVNGKVINDILFFVSNLRALSVESHNPKNLADYGLDRPGTMLTLGLTGDKGIQKSIMVGTAAKSDGIYVMIQGQDVVFVLKKDLIELLTGNLVEPAE